MKLHILRDESTDNGTPGALTVLELGWGCCSLEPPWRNNLSGVSCIVPDTYRAWPWYSPTLKRMALRLEDKHGRKDCLVHNANFAGDSAKGLLSQVHGCTAVGSRFGPIQKPNSRESQFGIMESVTTLERLLAVIGEGPHMITYEWGTNAIPGDLRDLNPLSEGAH